ncbi:uncharacterized protein LOC114680429 isoform X2 [Macaca mulatta]
MGPELGGGRAARSPPGSWQWADTEQKVADLGGHRFLRRLHETCKHGAQAHGARHVILSNLRTDTESYVSLFPQHQQWDQVHVKGQLSSSGQF